MLKQFANRVTPLSLNADASWATIKSLDVAEFKELIIKWIRYNADVSGQYVQQLPLQTLSSLISVRNLSFEDTYDFFRYFIARYNYQSRVTKAQDWLCALYAHYIESLHAAMSNRSPDAKSKSMVNETISNLKFLRTICNIKTKTPFDECVVSGPRFD